MLNTRRRGPSTLWFCHEKQSEVRTVPTWWVHRTCRNEALFFLIFTFTNSHQLYTMDLWNYHPLAQSQRGVSCWSSPCDWVRHHKRQQTNRSSRQVQRYSLRWLQRANFIVWFHTGSSCRARMRCWETKPAPKREQDWYVYIYIYNMHVIILSLQTVFSETFYDVVPKQKKVRWGGRRCR